MGLVRPKATASLRVVVKRTLKQEGGRGTVAFAAVTAIRNMGSLHMAGGPVFGVAAQPPPTPLPT